ncbi:MAG: hypothetical protein M0D57_05060 [Sphingobacteriales bacterium JAD_PAG50586_3]|nr:MAG: hypothetical protein M0D57_05060 [Sphingobacteriales bacterium JAD_PAG50586_3]
MPVTLLWREAKEFLFFAYTQKSCCGGKKMPKGCCKDVQLLCKADKHEVTSTPKVFLQKDVKEITASVQVLNNILPVTLIVIHKINHDPPDILGVPLHLLNSNFRI